MQFNALKPSESYQKSDINDHQISLLPGKCGFDHLIEPPHLLLMISRLRNVEQIAKPEKLFRLGFGHFTNAFLNVRGQLDYLTYGSNPAGGNPVFPTNGHLGLGLLGFQKPIKMVSEHDAIMDRDAGQAGQLVGWHAWMALIRIRWHACFTD